MDKQTTGAFILIGVILVVWLYINAPEQQPQTPQTNDSTLVEKSIDSIRDEFKKPSGTLAEKKTDREIQSPDIFSAEQKEEKIITVETDLVKLEMTSKGGKIKKYYLKDYGTWYYHDFEEDDFYNTHVQLINQFNGGDFDLLFVTQEGNLVNTSELNFESYSDNYYYRVEGEDSLTITYSFSPQEGKYLKKSFVFFGNNYESKVNIEMENMQNVVSGFNYDVIWASGINFVEENSVDEATYSTASAFTGGEQVTIDATSVGETEKKDLNGKIDWLGLKNKYFCVIISPDNPNFDGGASLEGRMAEIPGLGKRKYYNVSLKVPFKNRNYQKDQFDLYIGPVVYDILKSYDKNYETMYDFGSFFGLKFITRPISEYFLLPLFTFLHRFIPNYGFVIIVFSIIIKLLLSPLTKQSYKSMGKMQKLQPKIAEIKEKYKGDQQKIQKETMNLYSTYGVNPAGGCLPMVLQMPILFALFAFFRVAIEIRHEPFIFWITNLSAPDYFATLPFKIPIFGIDKVSGLAPLLGITMFFQQKMTMKDPSQKAMVYMMPIMFTLMFMGFSSGLNLYYFMFNILSIGQQYYINHKGGSDELVPVKGKKKTGFMQRMMASAEKQAKAQKQVQKKKRKF